MTSDSKPAQDPDKTTKTTSVNESSNDDKGVAKSWKTFILDQIPNWVKSNLNKSSAKLLVRCWLASWASFVLILPNSSLRTFGNAAFFTCMASVMMPPMFPVQVFIYSMGTLILGSLFGWAWGCAAMKAALTARDKVLLLSQIERVQNVASESANPDAEFQLEVFQGAFLQFRSSLVFGAFLGVGVFFLAVARASSPRLALFSVFGKVYTIFLDIICSYGPLFPAANYTILQSFLISTAASMAISCTTIVLIFPETLNHSILNGISKLLALLRHLIDIQEKILLANLPEKLAPGSELAVQVQIMVDGAIAGLQKINTGAPMLSVEFSYGRFNGEDTRSLIDPLTILVSRIAGLQSLRRMAGARVDEQDNPDNGTSSFEDEISSTHDPIRGTDAYLWRQLNTSSNACQGEDSVRMHQVFPLLHSATAGLREACSEALEVSEELITHINSTRWRKGNTVDINVDAKLDKLRQALDEFKNSRRLEVVEPFKHFQKPVAERRTVVRRMFLFYALVFEANLMWVAESILAFGEQLAAAAGKRNRSRLWAPGSLRSLWKILLMTEEKESAPINTDAPADPVEVERSQMVEKRDPDSGPPSNVFQHIGEFIFHIYLWCKTPKAIYAFKYTFITVALWLPDINYIDKGVWALIMAQTTLEPYIADQIFSYFARLTATSVGIVLGLMGWYIGAGKGLGNPYGIATVMAVLLLPLIFWRIFTPSFLPAIMCGVTMILVIGYSWIDAHLMLVGNPGVGWSVAWRRWLLVLIGSGASAIVMLIPPRSARKAIRIENASLIFQISQLYGSLISEWIVVEENADESEKAVLENSRSQMKQWTQIFRREFTKIAVSVQTLKVRTSLAKWEGSFRGTWPEKEYRELNEIETEMLSNLVQLAGALYHLDPRWRQRLLHQIKFLNPNFISEVMSVFSLVARSLRTAEPLQETVPTNLLDRVFYHHKHSGQNEGGETGEDRWDELNSPDYLNFAAGATAVYMIVLLLDRLHQVTVRLCGEVPMRGFAEWRRLHGLTGET